ncbi:COMTD1 [Branchiostoma lanceolatum]|uniref:COMTD1 protein n=1 Tax=Branchiostoma lanceolatum TaxID=7740 RepID=A0A8J9VX69_BRALA|nr:COMTD1 [Branchiostoma lanceolatum]
MDSVLNATNLVLFSGVATGAAVLGYLAGKRACRSEPLQRTFKSLQHDCGIKHPLVLYANRHSVREHPCLTRLSEMTLQLPRADMIADPEVTQLLVNIARAIGAKRAIEVGVYTGYTCLAIALSLPQDGTVVACDVDDVNVNLGRPYWTEAGVDHKIDVRIQPALQTLDDLISAGEQGTYDVVFIDADKLNYDLYYERALVLLRPGGLIALDNVLWAGKVLQHEDTWDEVTQTISDLNRKIHKDPRVDVTMLTVSGGLTLAFKR